MVISVIFADSVKKLKNFFKKLSEFLYDLILPNILIQNSSFGPRVKKYRIIYNHDYPTLLMYRR